MDTIISALIAAGSAIIVCLIQSNVQHQKQQAQIDAAINLIKYKIDQLKEQVEKHNKLIERTYKLEESVALHDEKIRVANHRIDDLEGEVHHET